MFFILKDRTVKQLYQCVGEDFIVYDRDSERGLSLLKEYVKKVDISSNEHKQEFLLFMQEMRIDNLDLFRYTNALFIYPYLELQPLDLEMDDELEEYLNKRINFSNVAPVLREILIYQNRIIRFDEKFLKTYRGEFAHADTKIIQRREA